MRLTTNSFSNPAAPCEPREEDLAHAAGREAREQLVATEPGLRAPRYRHPSAILPDAMRRIRCLHFAT